MRHLVEQVRRNGPLWLFSAFCFESANHQLLSALSGTIKNPEKMVERFLNYQNSVDELKVSGDNKNKCLENFTKMSQEVNVFCHERNAESKFSRFVNDKGKKFCSLSYTRLNDNLGESVVQLKDEKFVQVQCFVKIEGIIYAVVRYFLDVAILNVIPDHHIFPYNFCFELSTLGPLDLCLVENLLYKSIVCPLPNVLKVSVIREGFEHN